MTPRSTLCAFALIACAPWVLVAEELDSMSGSAPEIPPPPPSVESVSAKGPSASSIGQVPPDSPSQASPKEPDSPGEASPSPESPLSASSQNSASELSESDKLIVSLLEKNPFGSGSLSENGQTSSSAQAAEAPKGLELRSIFCVDDRWYFNIADTATKAFYTVPLGRKEQDDCPYTIDFFDDETNSISISNNVGSYTLTLKVQDPPTGKLPSMSVKGGGKQAASKVKAPAANRQNTQIRRR